MMLSGHAKELWNECVVFELDVKVMMSEERLYLHEAVQIFGGGLSASLVE